MEIANVDMAKAWDGDEGLHWTENEDRYNAASAKHGARLMNAAAIGSDENVLDVGCGCGESTRAAARAAKNGTVLGVDLSNSMLQRARQRADAEGLTNVRFEQADAQVHPFDAKAFDVVISKTGVMFFSDPLAAFRNIGRALRPDGRMVLLVWQEFARSEWLREIRGSMAAGREFPDPQPGQPSPVSLGNQDYTRTMLADAGFSNVSFEEVDEPMTFGKDADDAYSFLGQTGAARGLLDSIEDEATREAARESFKSMLKSHETPDGVQLGAPAWIITASR